ncbi:unnamed protein product [Closterium sp. NIES-65]|nr:unnamed protein product [Closterium sp. NIES-65]
MELARQELEGLQGRGGAAGTVEDAGPGVIPLRGPHWLVAGRVPQCKCAWQWMRSACFALPYVACPNIHSSPNQPTPAGQWEQLARVLRRAAAQSARVRVRMAMDALCFADERWLVCGSDTTGSAPSTIVLWDTSRPPSSSAAPSASPATTATPGASAPSAGPSVFHMPAFSSFVTCVAANPTDSRTIVAGGGDGGVALFDSRMHKAITRFSLGGSFEVRGIRGARGREVTSAAFSPCGRFFHAACSANCCFLFDSRCLPSSSSSAAAPPSSSSAPPSSSSCPSPSLRALFCLSHGPPMPSVQHSVQHAGFVDCGDEGVNDARWLSASPGFVTASGNGSVAVWDVSLADPLTAFSFAHTRSINTVKQSTCLADKAVALASPSLHGRLRGHPVTPALPFEASQKPFLCSSSPSLHDQVAVAPDDACIATGGDDQKVVSAFLSPLVHS